MSEDGHCESTLSEPDPELMCLRKSGQLCTGSTQVREEPDGASRTPNQCIHGERRNHVDEARPPSDSHCMRDSNKKSSNSQIQWHIPVTPALSRYGQKDCEFKANLDCIRRHCLKI